MKDFTFNMRLDRPVDPVLHRAFSEIMLHLQLSMNTIAAEHSKLQDHAARLANDNIQLSSENQRLLQENGTLRQQLGSFASTTVALAGNSNGTSMVRPVGAVTALTAKGSDGQDFTPATRVVGMGSFQMERHLKLHEAPVHSIAMCRTSKTIASASWDGTVKLWDASETAARTLGFDANLSTSKATDKMGGLYSVAFAKTADHILGCTSCDKFVYIWDYKEGVQKAKLGGASGHQDEVNGIDFHESQPVMCTASDDQKAIIWDFQEGIVLRTLEKHTKAVYGATFLGRDGDEQYMVATCCFDQKLRIFDMRDKRVVATLHEHNDDIIGIDYSPAKSFIATGSDDGKICLVDTKTWTKAFTINVRTDLRLGDGRKDAKEDQVEVKRVAFSKDGLYLAGACSDGSVQVYSLKQRAAPQHVANLRGHDDCVFDVAWGSSTSSNGTHVLASASHDKSSMLWRGKL